jgi:hypothetical protein
MTAEKRMRLAVRFLVGALRGTGIGRGEIRRKVRDAFHEALEAGTAERRMFRDLPDSEGSLQPCLSNAGVFRLVFADHGIDHTNPHAQERWWAIVERHLDEALADPRCVLAVRSSRES